jgi:hypothetical protein
MNKITFPLRLQMIGPAVGDLQAALQALLDRGLLLRDDEGSRRELSAVLARERPNQTFGSATAKLVARFQEERQLEPRAEVDERTAKALNDLLQQLGLLDDTNHRNGLQRLVSGSVNRSDQQPFSGIVRAFHVDERGTIRLGEDKTGPDGTYTIRYEPLPDIGVVNLRVSVLNENGRVAQSSDVIRNAGPIQVIDLIVPFVQQPPARRQVEGRVVFDHGGPAKGLTLRLYRLGFGGAEGETRLNEMTAGEHGVYSLQYTIEGQSANLEVRAVDSAGKEISLSKIIRNATDREVLNLVAPADSMPATAEFTRLSSDLQPHIGGDLTRLRSARETAERQDLTILHEATGWDARLIATAAMSTRLSGPEETGLSQDALYGLLRVGLPSDKVQLARVSSEAFDQGLAKARAAGIVDLTNDQVTQAKESFNSFSVKERLAVQAPGSNATYGDLLGQLNLNETQQQTFAKLYLDHRGDAKSLWDKATTAGLGEVVPRLQTQGKLAFLTTNNAPLMTRLQADLGDAGPEQLVTLGLYKKENWVDRITAIPPAFAGALNPKDAYASDLARKVRISYSTEVTFNMIQTGELNIEGGNENLSALLKNAIAKGFKLGQTQIDSFLKANPDVFAGIGDADRAAATGMLKTLHRVYQITPGNDSMKTLLQHGLLSAQDVLAYPLDVFLDQFGDDFPSIEEARLVYRKAEQISNISYSLFSLAKELQTAPPVFALSAPTQARLDAKEELVKHFPTMQSLFGSLDYCECEQCGSVLSPTAYLVDLLQFLDREPMVWANTMKDWKKKHPGATYPFKTAAAFDKFLSDWRRAHPGQPDPKQERTPYEILIERRPDLPHIQLTCENTNTALPQIDLVNEILEYFVANGALKSEAARDTEDATTAELLGEPQHVITEAYTALQQMTYPLALPFDLWLETTRQFTNYFETPLWKILDTFRKRDDLFAPAEAYDRAAIFFESLELSPAELAIFTNPDPLSKWFELYGYATEAEALTEALDPDSGERIDLNSAKALARRLGVTYKQVVEIVQTSFVNPTLAELVTLHKLGIETSDVFFYQAHRDLLVRDEQGMSAEERALLIEVKAIEQRLQKLTDKFKDSGQVFNAREWLQTALDAKAFDTILVLADSDAGCNFDKTILRFANTDKADALTFLKINLFVRLWRKLGWTIEETDRALTAFLPKNAPFDKDNLNKAPLKTALIYLAHLNALASMLRLGAGARLKLLTLWTSLPTTGSNPLYAQLFLKRSILKSDPVFDHPLGKYLSADNVLIKDHLLALQGALGLTSDEIERILKDAGQSLASAKLSLPNVSLLYRYSLLAKGVGLSVPELIALKQLSVIDPFTPLHADPLASIDQDHPFSETLTFVEIVEEVKSTGLKIDDIQYLLRHVFDENGKYRLSPNDDLTLLRTLCEGIRAIRLEHAVPVDPGGLSEDVLRQKLGLILQADVVERFLAMMNGSAEFIAVIPAIAQADQLHRASFVGEPSISQMAYNAVRLEQRIGLRGVLFEGQKTALKDRFNSMLTPGQQTTFAQLLDAVQAEATKTKDEFFAKYLEKQPLSLTASIGFLSAANFNDLVKPLDPIKDDLPADQKKIATVANEEKMRVKRSLLATTFLPYLQTKLIRQFVVQTLTAATTADPLLVESLLVDKTLLADPANNAQSLLDAFTAADESGLSVAFFANADASGDDALANLVVRHANTSLKDKAGDGKPAGTNSARFSGYLEVPVAGSYRFFATLSKQDAEAELRFDHLPAAVFKGTAARDNNEIGKGPGEFVELKPHVPYHFTLTLRKLNGGDAGLLVQGETLPKDSLEKLTLYADAAVEKTRRVHTLLAKALQLIQVFELNEREVRYIVSHPEAFDGVALSSLPAHQKDDTPVQAARLFKQFRRLASYTRLKRELAGGSDDLIGVFEAPKIDDVYKLVARIGRREEDVVKATAEALFSAPGFPSEKNLQRLWEGLQVVETFGVPTTSVAGWTQIVRAPATPAQHQQRAEIARDLKETIKSRFEPDTWLRVVQPISDKLRQRQRDALTAHVMHQHHFGRLDQLFEFFLIDPGVEPVVQTSRIRSAIAAVQIFIHRCLLNLEPMVTPNAINSKQWQWMKRYPVWAGNRKLWLFPENVLEPEFRDDKTHLFTELEGQLLQSDVTNDLVEDAFFKYLRKLDELARLDIVAMYCEEQRLDPASNQLHVIGRTYLEPFKYFYRRYAHEMWTPWEPMPVQVEGNHIVPVIWRDRLNVFWVTFIDNPDQSGGPSDDKAFIAQTAVGSFKENVLGTKPLLSIAAGGENPSGKKITELSVGQMASVARSAVSRKFVKVQLHWSEYFQGEWCVRESGGYSASLTKSVSLDFDSTKVFIHATKVFEGDEERGVKIHLGGEVNQAFFVASRNSRPAQTGREAPPAMPYIAPDIQANRYAGSGAFKVRFAERIVQEEGKPTLPPKMSTPDILQQGGAFTLLPCANSISLVSDEISSLVTPVFYQDDRSNTFYIEPTFKEQTIEEWQEWVTRTPVPEVEWDHPEWWNKLMVGPMVAKQLAPVPLKPDDPIWKTDVDPRARFELAPKQDWLAHPATVMQFDGELVGPAGHAGLATVTGLQIGKDAAADGPSLNVNAGSAITPGGAVVAVDRTALSSSGLTAVSGGLNVVGGNGLNSALLKNMKR